MTLHTDPNALRCPLCGAVGVPLAVSFECVNPLCRNYSEPIPFSEEDLLPLLESMWEIYSAGEELEEFIERFFSEGGKIMRNPNFPDIEHALISEPEWLRRRMSLPS